MAHQERRRAERINDENMSLEIRAGGFDMSSHTLNISTSGLYCKVDRELPLMSRIKLMLMLKDPEKKDKQVKAIDLEGVVVRAHPVIIDGKIRHYDVAIFFDSLDPKTKDIIADYISKKSAA